jgi:hypothetical protein
MQSFGQWLRAFGLGVLCGCFLFWVAQRSPPARRILRELSQVLTALGERVGELVRPEPPVAAPEDAPG